jgi:hypothetical protein
MKYGIGIRGWAAFYTHYEWQELYKKYCDPEFPTKPDFETKAKIFLATQIKKRKWFDKVVAFLDYRYNRITEAWNSEQRWKNLWLLFKNSFRKP